MSNSLTFTELTRAITFAGADDDGDVEIIIKHDWEHDWETGHNWYLDQHQIPQVIEFLQRQVKPIEGED